MVRLPSVLDMNFLIVSTCPMLLECSLTQFLKFVVCQGKAHSTSKRALSEKLTVEYNSEYVMFNMHTMCFQELLMYIKSVMCNNHVIMNRSHVLVLKEIQCLTNTQQHSITKICERNKNVRLIATSSHSRGVSCCMSDHFGFIRVSPPEKKQLVQAFQLYRADHAIEDHESTLAHCNYDMRIALKSLAFPSDMIFEAPLLFDALEREITTLLEGVRKTVQCSKIISLTRQSVYKMMKYNIPHARICRKILKVIVQKHKKKSFLFQMARIIADMEHSLLQSSKPIFYYELIVLKYTQLCAN